MLPALAAVLRTAATRVVRGRLTTLARRAVTRKLRNEVGNLQKSVGKMEIHAKVEGVERFNAALKDYLRVTKKTIPQALNDKSLFISRGAVKNTFKPDKQKVSSALEANSKVNPNLTVAQMLVIDKARENGETLTKGELSTKVRKLKGARTRAIGFLRTGWFPAIKAYATAIGRAASNSIGGAKKGGRDKGYGITAKDTSWTPKAVFENQIIADNRTQPQNYMQQGLDASFQAEAASMEAYLEKKMKPAADKFNRTN